MKLSIIIPCYNEEKGIAYLASQLKPVEKILRNDYKLELIFVDDGSKDDTYKLLQRYFGKQKDVKILRHKKNMNLGAALKTGFKAATGDIVVTLDSDCTYPPKEIPSLLSLLGKDTDIVTASPYHPKGKVLNVPDYRLALSKGISAVYRLLTGKKIYTFTSLFRAYKREVIKNFKPESSDFLAVTEMLVYPLLKGYKVKEFPTTLNVRKYGRSNIRLFKVIISHLKFILKIIKLKLR